MCAPEKTTVIAYVHCAWMEIKWPNEWNRKFSEFKKNRMIRRNWRKKKEFGKSEEIKKPGKSEEIKKIGKFKEMNKFGINAKLKIKWIFCHFSLFQFTL